MKKYIREAKKIDAKFKKVFSTEHSFILQYDKLYELKMAIDGVNLNMDNWDYILLEICERFDSLLEKISNSNGVTREDSFCMIIKELY